MKKTILILLCGWFAIMATRAQCAAQNEAIQAGEELVYDLKFNWKFIWVGRTGKNGHAGYYLSGETLFS